MSDKWWHTLSERNYVNVVILQLDLGSHTKAAEEMSTDFQAFKEFKKFGQTVENELSQHGFECLYWLGDGGLLAKECKTNEDAESVCPAAHYASQQPCFMESSSATRLVTGTAWD